MFFSICRHVCRFARFMFYRTFHLLSHGNWVHNFAISIGVSSLNMGKLKLTVTKYRRAQVICIFPDMYCTKIKYYIGNMTSLKKPMAFGLLYILIIYVMYLNRTIFIRYSKKIQVLPIIPLPTSNSTIICRPRECRYADPNIFYFRNWFHQGDTKDEDDISLESCRPRNLSK